MLHYDIGMGLTLLIQKGFNFVYVTKKILFLLCWNCKAICWVTWLGMELDTNGSFFAFIQSLVTMMYKKTIVEWTLVENSISFILFRGWAMIEVEGISWCSTFVLKSNCNTRGRKINILMVIYSYFHNICHIYIDWHN